MSASEFDVPGISCGKCVGRIEAALAGLDGVDGVTVDVGGKQVRVSGTADEGVLRTALADAGYPADA